MPKQIDVEVYYSDFTKVYEVIVFHDGEVWNTEFFETEEEAEAYARRSRGFEG